MVYGTQFKNASSLVLQIEKMDDAIAFITCQSIQKAIFIWI